MKEVQPDFKNTTTQEVREYQDMIQKLIFCYDKGRSIVPSEVILLKKIWKDIANEESDRIAKEAIKSLDSKPQTTWESPKTTPTPRSNPSSIKKPLLKIGKPVMSNIKKGLIQ